MDSVFKFLVLMALVSSPALAYADDNSPTPSKSPTAEEITQNNRARALEGSRSPFSGQFNISYAGSSINHPFIGDVGNPGKLIPPPLVLAQGTVALRYRVDDKTSLGLGLGLTTLHPFQGPSDTTLANPTIDLQRSFKIGPLHNRADAAFTIYTDQQNHVNLGADFGFTVLDEIYYEFSFGLTAGLLLEFDANLYSPSFYDPNLYVGTPPQLTVQPAVLSNQVGYDIIPSPYFEYTLSKKVNLRSVIGIQLLHTLDRDSTFSYFMPDVYQTFGVGISILEAWYFYPYFQFFPYNGIHLSTQTVFFGFNTVINLF
jgi:hypothetical protein